MDKSISIHPPVGNNGSIRLNMLAGRALSEQAFDIMQAYVDERCDSMLLSRFPGIVEGLDVSVDDNAGDITVRVQPGIALGADGRAIRLFFPTDMDWSALLAEYQLRTTPPDVPPQSLNGFYYLTAKRRVAVVDESEAGDPCARNDPNPLRDSRVETYGTLDLQFITDLASLMAMPQQRAANRLCAQQLNADIFDRETGAVPLALLRIDDDAMAWIDVIAGRYRAQKNSPYDTFSRHWEALVAAGVESTDSAAGLAEILGVDFLPAAGSFPTTLIDAIPGRQNTSDATAWDLPSMQFASADLQIELLPIPANTSQGVIENELQRGAISLVRGQRDRMRLMVAVDESAYQPDLMNLPAIDSELVDDLYYRYVSAASDYNAWANQFFSLYRNIDRDVVFTGDNADDDSQALFDALYKVAGPENDFPLIGNDARREGLSIPAAQPIPMAAADFLSSLSTARSEQLGDGEPLPRPYSLPVPAAPADLEPVDPLIDNSADDGLYRLQADYKAQIEAIEADLAESFDLINETNDFVLVQRQHLDSITVSFASLAGGVPGDGSGSNLARWLGKAQIFPQVATVQTETENNG